MRARGEGGGVKARPPEVDKALHVIGLDDVGVDRPHGGLEIFTLLGLLVKHLVDADFFQLVLG